MQLANAPHRLGHPKFDTSVEMRAHCFDGDVHAKAGAKSGLIEPQLVPSLVQTREGLPIAHEVHPGHVIESATLLPMIRRLIAGYRVTRVVQVADRGLSNLNNLEQLRA